MQAKRRWAVPLVVLSRWGRTCLPPCRRSKRRASARYVSPRTGTRGRRGDAGCAPSGLERGDQIAVVDDIVRAALERAVDDVRGDSILIGHRPGRGSSLRVVKVDQGPAEVRRQDLRHDEHRCAERWRAALAGGVPVPQTGALHRPAAPAPARAASDRAAASAAGTRPGRCRPRRRGSKWRGRSRGTSECRARAARCALRLVRGIDRDAEERSTHVIEQETMPRDVGEAWRCRGSLMLPAMKRRIQRPPTLSKT